MNESRGGSRYDSCMFDNLHPIRPAKPSSSGPEPALLTIPGEEPRVAYVLQRTARLAKVYWAEPSYVVHTWIPLEWLG